MQRTVTETARTACAAAVAAAIAIAVFQAARLPFPIPLSPSAWAHWVLFIALVHTSHTLLGRRSERPGP